MEEQEQKQEQEQKETPEQDQRDDMLKNLKAEMDRKLSNQTTQLDELKEILQKQAEGNTPQPKPTPEAPTDNLDDLMYSNPAEYTRRIKDEMRQEWQTQQSQRDQVAARQQTVLTKLVGEFPELSNASHSLTTKAVEIYNGMDDSEKTHAHSYKTAVYQAAMELGVVPSSKREQGDDFVLGSKGTIKQKQEADIDPMSLEFAKALGIDVDNKDYQERLKKHAKRDFGRYN